MRMLSRRSIGFGFRGVSVREKGDWRREQGIGDMDRNIGPEDRVFRIVIAIGLALLVYLGVVEDTAAIVTGVVAAYLLLSGLLSRCIFYKMVGVDTSIQEQPYSTSDDRSGL
jgi:hypothetical protein